MTSRSARYFEIPRRRAQTHDLRREWQPLEVEERRAAGPLIVAGALIATLIVAAIVVNYSPPALNPTAVVATVAPRYTVHPDYEKAVLYPFKAPAEREAANYE